MALDYPVVLVVLGIALIILEFAVFGFASLFLVFTGLGCLLSALLMWVGLIPETLPSAFMSVAISAFVFALALWRPMRRLQSRQQDPKQQPNTVHGYHFRLAVPLSGTETTSHRYSGINWTILLVDHSDELAAGDEVEVVRAEVGKMWVKRAT